MKSSPNVKSQCPQRRCCGTRGDPTPLNMRSGIDMLFRFTALLTPAVLTAWAWSLFGQEAPEGSEERVIQYHTQEGLQDPVATLQKWLANGTARLRFEPGRGYLPSLLKALRIPVSSQVLAFSKTSSQRDRI